MSNFRWLNRNNENGVVNLEEFTDITIEGIEYNEDNVVTIAILDSETTGIDYKEDKIIELAYLKFLYDIKKEIPVKLIKTYDELNDPEEPLKKDIVKITGITDKEVKDKKIDWDEVNEDLKDVDICICHNTRFDRSFVQKYTKVLNNKVWLCSYVQIPWFDEFNFPVSKQEILSIYHGFYYSGHRALTDCKALLNLLIKEVPNEKGLNYLTYLYNKRNDIEFLVIAKNTDYKQKSFFNENKFLWDNNNKIWHKSLTSEEESLALFQELSDEIYSGRRLQGELIKVQPEQKFKPIEELLKEVSLKTDFKHNKKFVLLAKKTPFKVKVIRNEKEIMVESRFFFKLRGYTWYDKQKIWFLYVDEDEIEQEKEWLRKNIYDDDFIGEIKDNKFYKK